LSSDEVGDPRSFDALDHSGGSDTIGWLVMVALAVLVFELTADPAWAVVLGCLKFGTPDLRVARWLRRADPNRVRGCSCAWFYITLAVMRIGFTAFFLMLVLFPIAGAGIPQGQIGRQLLSALIVILACFTGAAFASWMAVGSALRGGVRVWMDATAKSAVRRGFWPTVLPERSRRADLGPGLIVAYAFFSGWVALIMLISALMIPVSVMIGIQTPALVMLVALEILGAILGFLHAPRMLRRIEATGPWECYGVSLLELDPTRQRAAENG
jgi:hypothetical protein